VVNPETGALERTVIVPIIVGKIVTLMPTRRACVDSSR
jgi:hypothetical protein